VDSAKKDRAMLGPVFYGKEQLNGVQACDRNAKSSVDLLFVRYLSAKLIKIIIIRVVFIALIIRSIVYHQAAGGFIHGFAVMIYIPKG